MTYALIVIAMFSGGIRERVLVEHLTWRQCQTDRAALLETFTKQGQELRCDAEV